jgi:hypothetical protein
MGQLAEHLKDTIEPGLQTSETETWGLIAPLLPELGLEGALLKVPPTPALEAAIVARTVEFVLAAERKIIAEVFERKRILRFTRLVGHLLKPQGGIPVVTTNYDRLIEIGVEEAGIGIDTLFVGQFAGHLNEVESRLSFCREVTLRAKQVHYRYRPRANVFKPHGSLDWYHREGKPVRYSGDLDSPRLIITPGLNKFRNGYESPFDRHRERANVAIDRASRFLVIGYGFNDDHLETHLTPRIRGGVPTLLLTHTLSSNAALLVAQCSNIIAIEQSEQDGEAGSSVSVAGVSTFIPGVALWDLGDFITEVLEP